MKLTNEEKNRALLKISESILNNKEEILKANRIDVENAEKKGIKRSLIDRLLLNEKRILEMAQSCKKVAALDDPVGEILTSWLQEDGLRISKIRVPIGSIGIIYESRPNVTLEAYIIAMKAGNTVLLRGGSDAYNSNTCLVKFIKEGLKETAIPENSIEYVLDTSRDRVSEMLKMNEYLSLIIPRGGSSLIKMVVNNSTVPVLETGVGNCHIFVDETADLGKAVEIIDNAKTQRPGTCNAVEKVLIHEKIAGKFLPLLKKRMDDKNVLLKGCERTVKYIDIEKAQEDDWGKEYLDLILGIKIVDNVKNAIDHINKYSSNHSESILTENYFNAKIFVNSIDSAALYVNASTRFTDGGKFGFGGEIGISTQKLHARGPVGLEELTTYKYIVTGDYQTRS
jgi:glutamate-5-semialdehyde dehydrogenase